VLKHVQPGQNFATRRATESSFSIEAELGHGVGGKSRRCKSHENKCDDFA
jgi:hypothetical protein